MTQEEIDLNSEFNNEFDILYNNITSNQAPGLDLYEKSVFLTRAQLDIVRAYFSGTSNKEQKGFDGNGKRQIDFSMITESVTYDFILDQRLSLLFPPKFDVRPNGFAAQLPNDIFVVVNEYVEVQRNGKAHVLQVLPINFAEYSRLMNKPFRRPLKNQAWRLINSSDGTKHAEFIIGPNDIVSKYTIRYVRRPRAIRLEDFQGLTIDGESAAQCCELDPILYPDIIQRACELAKATYIGDLQSQIVLGQSSQTSIGIGIQNK